MSILTKLFSGGGGIGGKIVDAVQGYFPNKEDKAKIEMAIMNQAHSIELELLISENEFIKEHNQKIKDLEGTAKDLEGFGLVGKLIIFLRGLQRPLWGYCVMYLDFMVFSGKWDVKGDEQMMSAFWVINLLVLGFLFGERAVKNVMPIVANYFGKK
jgi:hypothetical protein